MKWEEESKAMIGTFLHNFTNPAIEQLVRTGKEKIYRCAEDDVNTNIFMKIFLEQSVQARHHLAAVRAVLNPKKYWSSQRSNSGG